MNKIKLVKVLALSLLSLVVVNSTRAFPDYLKIYAADPLSRPELRRSCSTCHVNPAGGGERNDFGKAFEAAGNKISDDLRRRFPDKFNLPDSQQAIPVTFVSSSDSQAIVELNGKKYLIDTKTRQVKEISEIKEATPVAPSPTVAATRKPDRVKPENPDAYLQSDVRLVNLPTAKPIAKGELFGDFTHRFPFGEYEVTDLSGLLGLDGFAVPSFGFAYGLTDRIHVGAYRSPDVVGRPISIYAGASLADEQRGHPVTAMARIGLEGRDNFQRNFTTSLELVLARSVTSKAQLYFVPTISFNNRPFGISTRNLPGENTYALGLGGALRVRPSVSLLAEANWRVNDAGKFGTNAPVYGFGIEKETVSKRHAFSLIFTNGAGTTMAQRSATRRSLLPGSDESFRSMSIGFNLSRRIF